MFTHNLTIYRGTVFSERLLWTENSIAVDLGGWKAKARLRNEATGSAYDLSTDTGEIELGSSGEIDLLLNADNTAVMQLGSYVWDILLMNTHGDIQPPMISGIATVLQGVTVW